MFFGNDHYLELFRYQIKVFNFTVHLLIFNFCCSFNGLLSLKQCNYYWTNFVLVMLYSPFFADATDIGIDASSRYFLSRPTSSSLFNRMLMTCFTAKISVNSGIPWHWSFYWCFPHQVFPVFFCFCFFLFLLLRFFACLFH